MCLRLLMRFASQSECDWVSKISNVELQITTHRIIV